MFVETIEAVSTSLGVIDISEKVFPTFKRIFKLIKNGELRIAIVGAGGTGKSTLGKLLSNEFEFTNLLHPYQESMIVESYKLDSNVVGSIIVAPGQERRHDKWDDLMRDLSGGKYSLIIHVVSWGYHSLGGVFSYAGHPLYQTGMTPEQFIEEYTKDCRKRELEVLKKIVPHLSIANQKRTVLVTLITKQDLWWNNRLQVRDDYMNGGYDSLIQSIRNKRGSSNFVHEYLSASLVMENFMTGANEALALTTQGYDRRLQFSNFRYFLNSIEALLGISLNVQEN